MSKIEEGFLVATYGTLKKDYNNYKRYLTRSEYLGAVTTKHKYPLVIKDMPHMIEEEGIGFQVDVDVFTVSPEVLKDLDVLEGHPTWYKRKVIPIDLNGETYSCWVYFSTTEVVGCNELHKTYIQEPGKTYEQNCYPDATVVEILQTSPKESI